MNGRIDPHFWRGKRVLVTGHTGFKGAWTTAVLRRLGAEVLGMSLAPDTTPNLCEIMGAEGANVSVLGDIRDSSNLAIFQEWQPQVVLHMAAQALVRHSYADPVGTYLSNIVGTLNVLEALRGLEALEAILVITTDKVYRNDDSGRAFVEGDPLGGQDPYSASKAGAEIVAASHAYSFLKSVPVATARAGNVIGGGDWSRDRIVPDIWRANREGRAVTLRMPEAVRPWQHVLEPVAGYLIYCQALATNPETPRALNFGPPPGDILTVAEVTERFLSGLQSTAAWVRGQASELKEMKLLLLDPSLARISLNWKTRFDSAAAIDLTSAWYRAFDENRDVVALTMSQIDEYLMTLAMDD